MFLEIHDGEAPTLMGITRNIDYDYQAEQWVIDSCAGQPMAIRWVLFTASGTPLREWRRKGKDFEEVPVTSGTVADPRSLKPRGDA